MFKINPLTQTDFYKVDHRNQYPKGTTLVYSNLTARSDKLSPCHDSPLYGGKMVVFGIQYFIKSFIIDLFNENFFKQPKDKVVAEYKRRIETSLGKDAITYEHIEALHDLGYMPIQIKALPEGSPERKGLIKCLYEIFGGETKNSYTHLDSHIGAIYGDSITLKRAYQILKGLAEKGFASDSIVFGIGSYTYQYSTRYSFGMAVKSTYGEVNGEPREIFKEPKTDNGIKKSAKGLLRVDLVNGEYVLKDQCTKEEEQGGELETVFKDGVLVKETSLSEIRNLLNYQL